MSKIIYQYDEETRAFVRECVAQASPAEPEIKDENGVMIQEQVYIMPIHSTLIAPPAWGKNHIPVFHEELQAWRLDQDFRGETWFNVNTGDPVEVTEIGQPDLSLAPVLPDSLALQLAKTKKVADLRIPCCNAITAGFQSDATGQVMSYGYGITDQNNLISAAMAGVHDVIWCANTAGVWARVTHTAEQIMKVSADAVAHRAGHSAKMAGLVQNVMAAQSLADVDAITWEK